jgi:nucleotide-binding universal stress UspA family protein
MSMDDWDIKTILLGYDGSEGADQAVRLASFLARQNKARVVVVSAFHWSYSLDAMGERAGQAVDEAETIAQRAVLKLQADGLQAEPDVLDGTAGEALLRSATAHGADLIVVGRRGHGLAASLLLGSTSEYVVRRATVPVLVAH